MADHVLPIQIADEISSWWRIFANRGDHVDARTLLQRACGDLFNVLEIDRGLNPDTNAESRQDVIDALSAMAEGAGIGADETQVLFRDHFKPASGGNGKHAPAEPMILSKAEFLAGFVPPDYLIERILQRRFIYALTGQTGHAKTAVALLVARLISCQDRNARLGQHQVEKGRVVYFVGENPDDVRMRIIGANALRDDNPDADDIWFIPGVFNIAGMIHSLEQDFRKRGECSLIIIDTSAAYFLGNEELSNTQMGSYARMLRTLTTLPGGPTVLVLCHPIKHVIEPAQLLPRGGGAYLAEMDGNLTLWRTAPDLVEMSYNKMRGPGFQPMSFRLDSIHTPKLVDRHGTMLSTVQAVAITQLEENQRIDRTEREENRVLAAMLKQPDGTLSDWAEALEWFSENNQPSKMKVQRIIEQLSKNKLTHKERHRWVLTDSGKAIARNAGLAMAREAEDKSQTGMEF